MDSQTPGVRQELSTASGRRIWSVTLGTIALLIFVMLAFVVIRKYALPSTWSQPPHPVQTPQP
jgi:hypothetical protein